MALVRWGQRNDLFSQLERMQREMESLMGGFGGSRAWRGHYPTHVYPALNIYDDGETFIVRAEAPGVDQKSIDLQVVGDTLTLRGERKPPDLPAGASYHRQERDFGSFHRSLTLPERVSPDKVVATFNEGILEVRLPRADEAKARKIAVRS